MHDLLRDDIRDELRRHATLRAAGDVAGAWAALERAHVLSQSCPWLHLVSHWHMLALGLATGELREALGQLVRLLAAAPASALGRAPLGNTGRAAVGILTPMPIPAPLAARLRRGGVAVPAGAIAEDADQRSRSAIATSSIG